MSSAKLQVIMNRRALVRLLVVLTAVCSLSCRTGEYSAGRESEWLAKGYRYDKNGWIYLHIEGGPFERGFQRGINRHIFLMKLGQ